MKYCGCGCQNSCAYPRMRGSDTPLILRKLYAQDCLRGLLLLGTPSGINAATRRAVITIRAPKTNGGPGTKLRSLLAGVVILAGVCPWRDRKGAVVTKKKGESLQKPTNSISTTTSKAGGYLAKISRKCSGLAITSIELPICSIEITLKTVVWSVDLNA